MSRKPEYGCSGHIAGGYRMVPTRRSTLFAVTTILLMVSVFVSGVFATPLQGRKPGMVTLIVKMAKGLTAAQQRDAVSKHGGTSRGEIPKLDLQVIEVPQAAADAIIEHMKGDASILRVEQDITRK